MSPTIKLLKELVSIPSVTPIDGGCLDLVEEKLSVVGFTAEAFNSNTVSNRWFTHGKGAPVIMFLGHVDVVPTGPLESWLTEPFTPTEIDGFLHGRGACDMKGGVAAMTMACTDFVAANPNHKGTIAILLTSDEEGPSTEGTVLALAKLLARGQTFDFGIVAEPTCSSTFGDVIKNGRRGSLTAKITFIGKQGHVAYPHKAVNAIHHALPALLSLTQIKWDEGNKDFPPTTMQIANINAGTGTGNVIPGEMSLDMNWRHGTASSSESLITRTMNLLIEHNLFENRDFRIQWKISAKPYLTTGTLLVDCLSRAIYEVTGLSAKCETTGGTSDGRFLAEHCAEVVEFGTRNATIHQANERVSINEVDKLKTVFQALLDKIGLI